MTQSSNYPFYVQLDGTNGLMLGQHVYVEPDIGQQEVKTGIWLSDYFINDIDSNPYVWTDDGLSLIHIYAVRYRYPRRADQPRRD